MKEGYCEPDTSIRMELDGGILEITVSQAGSVKMTGPAESVYEGELAI